MRCYWAEEAYSERQPVQNPKLTRCSVCPPAAAHTRSFGEPQDSLYPKYSIQLTDRLVVTYSGSVSSSFRVSILLITRDELLHQDSESRLLNHPTDIIEGQLTGRIHERKTRPQRLLWSGPARRKASRALVGPLSGLALTRSATLWQRNKAKLRWTK